MIELQRCPFCNGLPEVRRIGNDHTKKRAITIRCPSCRVERTDAALHQGFEWLETVAAKNWNTRSAVQHNGDAK